MAYTKILVIHDRLDKSVDYVKNEDKTSLERAVNYALNRDKTERVCFETAINCDRETVYADMMRTKQRWGKAGRKRKGYHIIQSFAPGEVTPEQAHEIGVELAERLFGDRYEAVVATHLNKDHLHSHIVFNSVSFVDGTMYQDRFKDYYGGSGEGIRGTSDAICLAHGLSVIEPSELSSGPVSRAEWEAKRQGKPTLRGLIRQDIDAAIAGGYTINSFWRKLEQMGYAVKRGPNVKHAAVKPPGGQRYIRLDSLGAGYSEADIKARLSAARSGETPPVIPEPAAPLTLLAASRPGRRYRVKAGASGRPRRLKGFRALYFKYLYLLGAQPRRRARALSSRAEIVKFDRYQEQFQYLMKRRIETAEQLSMQYDALQAEIDALTDRRKNLYPFRRYGSEAAAAEIEAITKRLRRLRRELKLCVRIESDIPTVRAGLRQTERSRGEDRPNEKSKNKSTKTR